MIKAIILDVDGIIVGEKVGFNFPHPHADVLAKLKEIRLKGIPIILCTAKPLWSIQYTIQEADLNNPHITNAGALLIDPIDNKILAQNMIENSLAREVLKLCLDNNVYVEFYTVEDYFISTQQKGEITEKHNPVIQKEPKAVEDLLEESMHQKILRIMPIARDEEDKNRVDNLLNPYKERLSVNWGLHPVAAPLQFGIVTPLGISKKEGAQTIISNLTIDFADVLGVSDTTGDWNFMELCGYTASVANGSLELKELVKTKGEKKFYVGKSVDENGILDVFNYFSL